MIDHEAADVREAMRTDFGSSAKHHNPGIELARQSNDLMFRDSVEEGELGFPITIRQPRFDIGLHVALERIHRAMDAVVAVVRVNRPPAGKTGHGALELFPRTLVDDVHDSPSHSIRKEIGGAVEHPADSEPAHADHGSTSAHRRLNQRAIADEMSIGGIDKTPTRKYCPVVTSIPRLRTSESQSMVAREP